MKKIKATGICLSILFSSFTLSFIFVDMVSADSSYYVSTTGNDSTGDGSIGSPWRTIQKAVNESVAGDTIYVREGSYNEEIVMKRNGTAGFPITLSGYQDEKAVINGSGISMDSWEGLIELYTGSGGSAICYSHIIIEKLNLSNSDSRGITAAFNATVQCTNITIRNCEFYNMGKHGVCFWSNDPANDSYHTDIEVSNCSFNVLETDETTGEGNTFFGARNIIFRDNSIKGCHKISFCFGSYVSNGLFHSNSIDISSQLVDTYGFYIDGGQIDGATGENIVVSNNYFYGTTVAAGAIGIASEVEGASVHNVTVQNNVINVRNCSGISSLYRTQHQYNISILYNTVYVTDPGRAMYVNLNSDTIHNYTIANNIFSVYDSYAIYSPYLNEDDDDLFRYNNLYYDFDGSVSGYFNGDTTDIFEATAIINDNPLFADISNNHFWLNDTSPAIDAADMSYLVSTDYNGTLRPQGEGYDIGAYEFYEESENPPSNDGYQFWNVTISDPDGDTTSGTIVCSDGSSMSWTDEANGTRSLNMTHLEYDTNYTVWLNFTDGVCSVYEVYWFVTGSGPSLAVDDPFPVDESVEVARPPVNISAFITSSDIDVYFYFVNMTPTSDVWTLVDSWSGISDERVAYTTLSTFGTTYEFLWGNTTYTWSVNCTDGESWVNETYSFTTAEVSVGGHSLRMDVQKNNVVNINDCLSVYLWYSQSNPYNGFYDVNGNNAVNINDCLTIYLEYV